VVKIDELKKDKLVDIFADWIKKKYSDIFIRWYHSDGRE